MHPGALAAGTLPHNIVKLLSWPEPKGVILTGDKDFSLLDPLQRSPGAHEKQNSIDNQ